MATGYRHPRGTRSALDTLAGASGLSVGQVYLITDEGRLAVATSTSAFVVFAKVGDLYNPAGLPLAFACIGQPTASYIIGRVVVPVACHFAANLASQMLGHVGTNPASSRDLLLQRRTGAGAYSTIGTVTISTGGTFSASASAVNIAAGDVVQLVAPSSADASLADITATFLPALGSA